MGDKGLLTDDYVADLLAKEAKDCSLKYSTMGMEAYTSASSSSSRPANKAKPNTRFLRNIIKGTEHHNRTLLAKEHAEAQARLREHATAEEEKRRKYRPNAGEIRGRQLGNIAALLQGQQGQKRKRDTTTEEEPSDLQKARAAEDARRLADTAAARQRQRGRDGKRRRSLERYNVRKDTDDDERKDRSRRANTSSDDEERGTKDRRRITRSRSPRDTPRRHRHRSPPREKRNSKSTRERSEHHKSDATGRSSRHARDEEDEDSDPLEDLIGPAPPTKIVPRGRGALGGSSGMDSRFSSGYDPKSDIQMDDEAGGDDWDEALEALRDRARFRQQGADRLRQAGFTEDQVRKWEKGDEKTIDDVKWTKAGEKREWDRGKDVEQEDSED